MELKNYTLFIVVNLVYVNIYCWASNLIAFERLSYNELASECLGEEYVYLMNTLIALAIEDCHKNSTLRYEVADKAANADKDGTDLDESNILTIIKKNGKDRDDRRMMNGGGEGGGEEEEAGGETDNGYGGGGEEDETGGEPEYGYGGGEEEETGGGEEEEAGGEPDYGYGGGEEEETGGEPEYGYGGGEEEETGGEPDYGYGGEEEEETGDEPDYGYGGGEEEETGGEPDYGYGGGETDYGESGGESESGSNGEGGYGDTGYKDYNGGGSENGEEESTYESYGRKNRKSVSNKSSRNNNKKGFRSNNNNRNKNSRKGFRSRNNNKNKSNRKGFRSNNNNNNNKNSRKGFRSNINRNVKNIGRFNDNNNQEYDYRKNRYNGRTPDTDSRKGQRQKYSDNNSGRGSNRGRGKDFGTQGRNLGQNIESRSDNQGYTNFGNDENNNDRITDYSNDFDQRSNDGGIFGIDSSVGFGFEYAESYARKKRKSSYRPDLTSISDLIIREIGIEDKFINFECVLHRRLELSEEIDIRNMLADNIKLNEKARKDFEESWNKCLEYVECVMEMFPYSSVFPKRMRRVLELGKCIQRQIRLNCIKNDIRNVLPSTSETNGTLTEIFDDLVTKLLEIVAFNGDMESFDLLLI
ncbi:UNVERIFIED_CONTAM: hypothetical protein RMT77_008120 [Armadillidium vulgare]